MSKGTQVTWGGVLSGTLISDIDVSGFVLVAMDSRIYGGHPVIWINSDLLTAV